MRQLPTALFAMLLTGAATLAQAPAPVPPAHGKVFFGGHWMRKYDVEKLKYADYMTAHGYRQYHGRWRRKAEIRKIQREVMPQLQRLTSRYGGTRRDAHERLGRLAEKHAMPRLVTIADRVRRDYDAWWQEYWRAWRNGDRGATLLVPTVTLGVNLQHSKVLGIDTVPVSLGVGNPVRIQLPRTRSISIGTTVTVPAGIGR